MAHSESRSVVIAALGANLLIAAAKLVAAAFTHSSAMLAEGFHSLADTGNQVFLLLGVKLSSRPADVKHPFGYGSERYFWAFIVAISIFTVGSAFSLYEGVHKIIHFRDPEQRLQHVAWALGVLGVSISLELFSWIVAARQFFRDQGRKTLSQTISDNRDPVVLTVLLEDSAALAGLLAALAGLLLAWLTGNMLFDGIASVVVGLLLAGVAFFLARETKDLLIGESVTPADTRRIRELVEGAPDVVRLVTQRTMHLGPEEALVALKIEFTAAMSTHAIEDAIDEIERRLRDAMPHLRRIWIEPGHAAPANKEL
jgi:cation diffusion facilitator family transporter